MVRRLFTFALCLGGALAAATSHAKRDDYGMGYGSGMGGDDKPGKDKGMMGDDGKDGSMGYGGGSSGSYGGGGSSMGSDGGSGMDSGKTDKPWGMSMPMSGSSMTMISYSMGGSMTEVNKAPMPPGKTITVRKPS